MDDNGHTGILGQVAPGTPLRQAIELIIQQETGGLVVLGEIDGLSSGGFQLLDTPFTPQKLAELAKMDGAIVLDEGATSILRANVQLTPDASIPTEQTGMRQRTAERVAQQTGRVVVAVSEGRETAAIYTGENRYELQSPTSVLASANQNLQMLERFRRRLDEADERLTRAEAAGAAIGRDVLVALQRALIVNRLGRELDRFAIELGEEGRLLRLQIADLVSGVDKRAELIYRDYSGSRAKRPAPLEALRGLSMTDLYDLNKVASVAELGGVDADMEPRGLRLLADMPRLPESVEQALLSHFSDVSSMVSASELDLAQVEGVGRARAEQLRRFFDRITELHPPAAFEED